MVFETNYKQFPMFRRGKVRDVYDLGGQLLIVSTDRISCFDVVLPTPIPDKGKILNSMSRFWFSLVRPIIDNHIISTEVKDLPKSLFAYAQELDGRIIIAKKSKVVPFECIVRGYISGSGWKEYKRSGTICGIKLPADLKESDKLPEPIFTPSTKADVGHDENVDFDYMSNKIGVELATTLKNASIAVYKKAADYALTKGIIIADTKFEFGMYKDKLILVDEVLTPDSSRFWPMDQYCPGKGQPSFDKQFVRDYLETLTWDKQPPGPKLPQEIVDKTKNKYQEALKMLTI